MKKGVNRYAGIKRYTVSIPDALHLKVKIWCATQGVSMRDVVWKLLEKEFGQHGAPPAAKTKPTAKSHAEARAV